jgi:pyrroloquinoline quinone (PQQ) biosynthesis protein C
MKSYVAALRTRLQVPANEYLVGLRDGALSREDFVETQLQFFFAVVFFSRPMAALAGRLPRPEMRLQILANVSDEHGEGRLRFCHERTFLELLSRLGVPPAEIERRALWPEVRAFNTTLAGLCLLDDTNTAVAALGIIEDLFAGISATIGKAIVARGWLPSDQVVHYATHEKLDEAHAEGFYEGLYAPYAAHPRFQYQIEQGLELGAYAFLRLYEDLWANRARRWTRSVGGPHSLADGWYLEPTMGGRVPAL